MTIKYNDATGRVAQTSVDAKKLRHTATAIYDSAKVTKGGFYIAISPASMEAAKSEIQRAATDANGGFVADLTKFQ